MGREDDLEEGGRGEVGEEEDERFREPESSWSALLKVHERDSTHRSGSCLQS